MVTFRGLVAGQDCTVVLDGGGLTDDWAGTVVGMVQAGVAAGDRVTIPGYGCPPMELGDPLIAYYTVLQVFDDPASVKVTGDVPVMEGEPGVVY